MTNRQTLKKSGATLAVWKKWEKEKGITPDKLIARLKRYGIAKCLWMHLATNFKAWEAIQN